MKFYSSRKNQQLLLKIYFVVILSLMIFSNGFPQSKIEKNNIKSSSSFCYTISSDVETSVKNSLDVLTSPYYFDTEDYLIASAIIGLTGASFTLDNEIRKSILSTKSNSFDNITSVGEAFGNAKYGSILCAFLYSTGILFDSEEIRETGQMLTEAMLLNGIFTELLKITFVRYRPFTGNTNLRMEPFEFELNSDENSLPSGHTSTAFTIATVLSEKIGHFYTSIALFSLASLTAYHRVYSDVHWFSDTFLGAALGTLIGLKIVSLHKRNEVEEKTISYSFYPEISAGSYKIGLLLKF